MGNRCAQANLWAAWGFWPRRITCNASAGVRISHLGTRAYCLLKNGPVKRLQRTKSVAFDRPSEHKLFPMPRQSCGCQTLRYAGTNPCYVHTYPASLLRLESPEYHAQPFTCGYADHGSQAAPTKHPQSSGQSNTRMPGFLPEMCSIKYAEHT